MSTNETELQNPSIKTEEMEMEMEKTPETNRMVGQVKWFNNKVGFGFITMKDVGDNTDKDIFVHYSTINVSDTQYRYLVQGEYVEFDLTTSIKAPHEYQSSNISGIKGGKLMCETRQLNRPVKKEREYENRAPRPHAHVDNATATPRYVNKKDSTGQGPIRQKSSPPTYKDAVDKDGFQVVRKKKI